MQQGFVSTHPLRVLMIVTNALGFKGLSTLFRKYLYRRARDSVGERGIAAPIDSRQGGSAPKR